MPARRNLTDSPDLDQLKRQAKNLLRDAHAAKPDALARFRILPSLAHASPQDIARAALALHDAQSVIAREHGFPSWNALRERVEELVLDLHDAAREFVEAATDGRTSRAERLLARYPALVGASLHAALVLGRADIVESQMRRHPSLARQPGGPRGWEPLHYICYTSLGRTLADADGLVAIARRLLELGADATLRFPWLHHSVQRPVLWGAVCVTRVLPLAEVLLKSGADPNDGVTLPLAASGGDVAALELLHAYGARPNQKWATDGAATLYAIVNWSNAPVGVQWLLDRGADPDPVFAPNGETPLHVAARRGDVALVETLVQRGADASRRRADGRTPYALAELNGNRLVADWLRAHGAADDLRAADRFVAACHRGDRAAAEALLAEKPELREMFAAEHYAALYRAAEQGDLAAVALLLDCGFDPNRTDEEMGKTALHSAAMAGRTEVVRLLLARGASTDVRDREFHAQPLVWAAEGARSHPERAPEYAEVARMLLKAGSPFDWQPPTEEPSEGLLEIISEWRRVWAADAQSAMRE